MNLSKNSYVALNTLFTLVCTLLPLPVNGTSFAAWVRVDILEGSEGIRISYMGNTNRFEHGGYGGWADYDGDLLPGRFAIEEVHVILPPGVIFDTDPKEPGTLYWPFQVPDDFPWGPPDWVQTFTLPSSYEHDGSRDVFFRFPNGINSPDVDPEDSFFGPGDTIYIEYDIDVSDDPFEGANTPSKKNTEISIKLVDRITGKAYYGYGKLVYDWAKFNINSGYAWQTNFVGGAPDYEPYAYFDGIPVLVDFADVFGEISLETSEGRQIAFGELSRKGFLETDTSASDTFIVRNTSDLSTSIGRVFLKALPGWEPWGSLTDYASVSSDENFTLEPGGSFEITVNYHPVDSDFIRFGLVVENPANPNYSPIIKVEYHSFPPIDETLGEWQWDWFLGEYLPMGNNWVRSQWFGIVNILHYPFFLYTKEYGWMETVSNVEPYFYLPASRDWIWSTLWEDHYGTGYFYNLQTRTWSPAFP